MSADTHNAPTGAVPCAEGADAPTTPAATCAKPPTMLEHALSFAQRGFAVFPLQQGAKTPLPGSNGHLGASTDPEEIRAMFTCAMTGTALPFNIGATPRDGRTLIVDLDVKDGRNGVAEFLALGGEIRGLVVQTAGGGTHVYFAAEDVRTGAGKLAPGIDTRGADGYVVAPGSVIGGVAYEIVEDGPIRPLPAFVAEKVGTRAERDRTRQITTYIAIESDRFANVRRAIRVAKAAEPAVGGQWHSLGFQLGAEMARIGLSGDMAVRVLERHWVPRGAGFKSRDRFVQDVLGGYDTAVREHEHGKHAVPDVRALFAGCPVVPPPPDPAPLPVATPGPDAPPMYAGWRRVCSASLHGKPIPSREWLVEGWLSPGHVTVLFGEGGTGKSILLQQLMLACATGREWLGLKTTTCSTFGLFCEDSEEELHRRQAGLCGLLGVDLAGTGGMAWISGADSENELVLFDRNGRMELTPQFARLMHEVCDTGARLVTVDTGACTFGGDENVRRQVTSFVRVALGRIAQANNAAVVLAMHPSRSGINRGDPDGGSTAWTGSARARWTLSRARGELGAVDPAERVLALPKSNYSVDGTELRMRRISAGFVPVVPLTIAETRDRWAEAENIFLRLLNRWNLQGRNVSPHPQASTYAAKVLSKEPDRDGMLRSDFEGAMGRLFNQGRLMVEEWGPPSKLRQRVVPTPGR